MGNYVILLAGGIGSRMDLEIPKQFVEVDSKPIIAYTLEVFERNPLIDKVVIVCIKDWIEYTKLIIEKYKIKKAVWITEGGATGHDSIRNGIYFLRDKINAEDYVVIHDAVRPILPQMTLNEVIRVAHEFGNASSSIVCHPPIVYTDDSISGISDVDRDHVMLTASPQVYRYSLVLKLYTLADKENKHNFTFTSSMLIHYGERVYFAKGTSCNIKITKKEDLALFRALLQIPEELLYS